MSRISPELFRQQTISRDVATSGIGIHTGRRMQIRLLPAPVDTGILFRRTDLGDVEIPVHPDSVTSVELATTLGKDDLGISTVEHLLAAVRAFGIDNLIVELDGPEVPILDGSALPWVRLLEAVGLKVQDKDRRILVITAPISVALGGKSIRLTPYPGFRIRYTIDFANSHIGHQELDLELSKERFVDELAGARTFAQQEDVEWLRSRGLGRGGKADNCIVFGDEGPVNTSLRFADEPVRHKALDAVGDLALVGAPIWGQLEVERGGHQVHFAMVEAIRRRPECWAWAVTTPETPREIELGTQIPALQAAAGLSLQD